MEKIININMAGRVIAIEDSAYTSLKAYLESLHRYFAGEEGRDEIINDIESRVAELMADKIKRGSLAISEADIEEIIGSMGRVEDFAAAEDEQSAQDTPRSGPAANRKSSRRFNRDTNDKIAGGVCAGLAAYLNVDPALVRIVFAILTLGGWGAGLLLYIALWIIVPATPLASFRGRRLFRDADDKWLGGVCAGIAAYFGKEPWIFRLIFASPFLLSIFSGTLHLFTGTSLVFGSFSGTFILIYVVLWAVLPPATSEFEKMEMRGEKVDLASIRENVMADFRERAKGFSSEVSESASRLGSDARQFMNTRGRAFAQEAAAAARPIASRGGHIIGTLLKAFFLFIGGTIAFSLFIGLIGYFFGGFSGVVNDFILRTPAQRTLSWLTIILVFGVPLLALVTFIVRRILRIRGGGRYFGWGYGALWFAGFICMICFAAALGKDFRRSETVSTEVAIAQPANGRLILTVPGKAIEYSNSLPWMDADIPGWDVADGIMRSARVAVLTVLSPDSLYHVSLKRTSLGIDDAEAAIRAGQIGYGVRNHSDSVLALDNGYSITPAQSYRDQNVVVEVQVPAGKSIHFDASVEDKLVSFRIPFRQRYGWHVGWVRQWEDERVNDDWEPGVDYVMGINGELSDALHPDTKVQERIARREEAETDRDVSRRMDSLDRAVDAIQRQKDRKMDSLDRAIEATRQQKEALEAARDN